MIFFSPAIVIGIAILIKQAVYGTEGTGEFYNAVLFFGSQIVQRHNVEK